MMDSKEIGFLYRISLSRKEEDGFNTFLHMSGGGTEDEEECLSRVLPKVFSIPAHGPIRKKIFTLHWVALANHCVREELRKNHRTIIISMLSPTNGIS